MEEQRVSFINPEGMRLAGIWAGAQSDDGQPAVVLCHGLSSSMERVTYARLQDVLTAHGWAVLRFDFSGHGKSEGRFEDVTVTRAVGDVVSALSWVREKGYSNIHLFGSSFGGLAAVMAAAQESVRSLALKSPVSYYPDIWFSEEIEEWRRKGIREKRRDGEKVWNLKYSFAQDAERHNGWKAAEMIRIPVLIVHGDADTVVPVSQSRELAQRLSNGILREVVGADHQYSKDEHFEEMFSHITSFFLSFFSKSS